jgi:hypothetical protein
VPVAEETDVHFFLSICISECEPLAEDSSNGRMAFCRDERPGVNLVYSGSTMQRALYG